MSLTQFRRSASLTVGRRGETAKVFTGLRIVFNVTKTESKEPNTATIEVYNLNEESRNLIKMREKNDTLFVILNAGYLDGDGEELVFTGNVKGITHQVDKPDIATVITAADGDNALFNSKLSLSHGAGVSADTILQQVLNAIPISSNFSTLTYEDKAYANGFSFVGLAKDALTKVTKYMGLNWSIQNNEIRLIPFDGDDKTRAVNLSPETGLIGSPERLTGSTRKAKGLSKKDKPGWRFRSLLQPKINPTGKILVTSREIKEGSTFTVFNVTHAGDNYGSEWETTIEVRE
jgi:hypothetical protein